ncbi:hypothetical protein BCR37DRAFT_394045 [Protomyces lactucae-debilis]|uniref:Arginine biosynthesis bifunctional protein ArgJ, mitochondrial n=1 Tax=Protomyces lactucae-debilis TaxID=2754530 RepID=A0A1Y2F804_PROLT|nr:uncharacterized protein BCR37DRAFT_394045 [Protomyces lactucae-debilis]ORY79979.1 hypothetical protein BCR37DRAFT_394045 [Protomyces lactucae-debilis]
MSMLRQSCLRTPLCIPKHIRPLSSSPAAAKSRFVPHSGTYPQGFTVSGLHCGVKKNGKPDLALLVSAPTRTIAAAVFTKNLFQAAPVTLSRSILEASDGMGVRGLVVNSGCANAVTGHGGFVDAKAMGSTLDQLLTPTNDGSSVATSLVMSTGVIGQRLPIDKILEGIPKAYKALGDTHTHWLDCAKAFCTTDTFPKLASETLSLPATQDEPAVSYNMAGIAKGAGMIHPDMATLLGFIATDAPLSPEACRSLLTYAVDRSFNSISVDGDMSTNDTLALFANGAAASEGTAVITEASPRYIPLRDAITAFCIRLAQLVVRDGEGATKFVSITVKDASSFADAKKIASTIATSALVKTALYGQDANWGRILCATGYAGVASVVPGKTCVSFIPTDGSPRLALLVDGEPEHVDEARASEILAMEDLAIEVTLGTGAGHEATYWTCDFSHEYVTINGDYRT